MGKEQVQNYLDIQLRDMDYLKTYGSNLRAAFLDPANWYDTDGYFEEKYTAALQEAKSVLSLRKANTIQTNNPVLQTLIQLYRDRLQREKNFISQWESFFGISRKGTLAYPMNGNYTIAANRKYAEGFSKFIQSAIGSKDDDIIQALRSDKFATQITGLESKVFSTKASNRYKQGKKKGQSNLNKYYESLFNTFFYKANGDKAGAIPISLEEMTSRGEQLGGAIFKKKFLEFIKRYYVEISPQVEQSLDSLGGEAMERIYKNFNKDNPKTFKFKVEGGRGVSKKTEKQLKKMLLKTLQEIADATSTEEDRYDHFTIPGLLEVNKEWTENESGFHMQIQLEVNKLREQRSDLKKRKSGGEKIDMRHYNRTYLVDHEDDMVNDQNGNPTQLKNLFLQYFKQELSSYLKREITSQEEADLSHAIFQKIDKTIKRGDKALTAMSIFGPGQMKGFLGEVATAYALQQGKGAKGEKVYTEVTGAERGAHGQLHYDVVAVIKDTMVGFQVKNYNSIENKGRTLYDTTIKMGSQDMYKYFNKDDVRYYRWLFANGRFISQTDIPDLRQQLEDSLFNSTAYFLRIADASIDGGVDSDIYVLGNFYIPSSYLIACAIDRVKRELEAQGEQQLFTLTGDFPAYRYKLEPKTRIDPKTGAVTEKHMSSGIDKNIVWLNKSRCLGKAMITFKGITVKFTI